MNYFFATDFGQDSPYSPHDREPELLNELANGLKVHMLCEGRDKILLRVENLSDLFDDGASRKTLKFDVNNFAEELYKRANRGDGPAGIQIVERTLSNN